MAHGRVILLLAGAAASAVSATGSASDAPASASPSLQQYLSSVSWPVRASAGRARALGNAIDGWLRYGDPPYLGMIAGACDDLLAVESRAPLRRVGAPPPIRASHAGLVEAYSAVRTGCARTRAQALAARASLGLAPAERKASDRHAVLTACTQFRGFARTTLLALGRAVSAWRVAATREARAHGVTASWLRELRLRVPRGAYSRPCPPPS